MDPERIVAAEVPITVDPPGPTRYRTVLNPYFTPRLVEGPFEARGAGANGHVRRLVAACDTAWPPPSSHARPVTGVKHLHLA